MMASDPAPDLERALRATLRAHAGLPHTSLTAAGVRAAAAASTPAQGQTPIRGNPAPATILQVGRRHRRKLVPWLAAAAVVGITSAALLVGGGPRQVPPAAPSIPSVTITTDATSTLTSVSPSVTTTVVAPPAPG